MIKVIRVKPAIKAKARLIRHSMYSGKFEFCCMYLQANDADEAKQQYKQLQLEFKDNE